MKERKVPMRKCVGCNTSKPKQELIRIAFYEGKLSIDESGRANGRGVYLCKDSFTCIDNAKKRKAIERSFGASHDEVEKLFEALADE